MKQNKHKKPKDLELSNQALYRKQSGNCFICGGKMWFPSFQHHMNNDELKKFLKARPTKDIKATRRLIDYTNVYNVKNGFNTILVHKKCNKKYKITDSELPCDYRTFKKLNRNKQAYIRKFIKYIGRNLEK